MSQRLLICKKRNITDKDDMFDCIYTEKSTVEDLLSKWVCFDKKDGSYFGPWKIWIRDKCFFDQFLEDFNRLTKIIPAIKSLDDIWTVVEGNKVVHDMYGKED